VERVVEELHKLAEKIDPKDQKEITEVATIASNNNPEIGKKLAEAMKLVGATNGVITVEEGRTAETEVHVVQGMQFDRGYLSPHFATNQEQMIVELDNAYILIYEEKITNAKSLIPLLETISKKKSRYSSSPRILRAMRWPLSCSTSSRASCRFARSRPRATAIAARPCSRTLPR